MTRRKLERALLLGAIIGALAATLSLLAQRFDLLGFTSLELGLYDRALRAFSPTPERSKDVVLVVIDDRTFIEVRQNESFARNYGNWPYYRTFWSDLTRHLVAEGARAVTLDVVMDEPATDPSGDLTLRDEILEHGLPLYVGVGHNPSAPALPKVEPTNRRTPPPGTPLTAAEETVAGEVGDDAFGEAAEALPKLSPEETARALAFPVVASGLEVPKLPSQKDRSGTVRQSHPIPPITPLLQAAPGFGLVHLEEDRDSVLRRTRFAYSDGANTYVTLPVAVAADVLGADKVELSPGRLKLGARERVINRDGSALIDYRGKLEDRFEIIPAFDVLNDEALEAAGEPRVLPAGLFQDKVVVVGGTALGTADVKANPFASQVHGVVKQAAILDSLLGGEFIVQAPFVVSALLTLLLAAGAAIVILRWRSIAIEVLAVPVLLIGVFVLEGVTLVGAQRHLLGATALFASVMAALVSTAVNHLFASQERERLKVMFSKYLSSEVVNQLAEQDALPRLSGERMEVTAFFSDIRGFSTFSERFKDDPEGLVGILNAYLTRVSAVLQTHGACLDKYIGDAIVCIFGAPVRHADHAVRACRGALAARAEVDRIRAEFIARGMPDVYTRIGLNTAVMFVGNIGSEQLFNYTAIGDGMNLAARLEGANKAYGTTIMMGPATYEAARDHVEARELDSVRVAGKSEPVTVYELLAEKGQLDEAKRQVVALYAEALALYRRAEFQAAREVLERAMGMDPRDGPSKALAERCEKWLSHPPSGPFEAVSNLEK